MAWRPEAYEGVGRVDQPECAIPGCHRPTESRGLCNTCFQAWFRRGMDGLQARAARVSGAVKPFRVPLDVGAALEVLIDVYEQYISAEQEEDHARLKKRLVKICDAIGNVQRRKRQRKFRALYVERKIKEIGVTAWRAKMAESQRASRKRRRLGG